MGMRPLVDSGILQGTIRYRLINDGQGIEVGTNRFAGEWDGGAAVLHFGSRDGKIPARPFIGISADDQTAILGILNNFGRMALG
jgi:phage gpG-like protein